MKVPFFRSKASTKNRSLSASASMATLNASKGQQSDLETFLGSIDSFRSESRRLFPEHVALDRILGELRDECQHRVDYMSRVSAMSALSSSSPPAPSPAQSNISKTTTVVSSSNDTATTTTSSSAAAAASRRRKTTGGGPESMMPLPSPSPSPPQLPAIATTATANRRRNPPKSMFIASLGGDDGPGGRPLSLAELNPKASVINAGRTANRTQHMPAAASSAASKSTSEYVMVVKIAGHKVEAAVSPALQTSLISMQLALMMGMPVTSVSPNSRVWSTGGKSWSVVGEVTGLPFVCGGNVTFSHTFKVVQGGAGSNDMSRDIVLGNDFCVGNKGRIKDNRLHLEQLCMPVSVPVRPITAA
ncbi:hypothetical protein LPJ59_000047 [Coemansia sp. RSA 2399]|nr:hypothetical protein LPJ59_000047 [Coemansia sp. RSA 2399]KAJ1908545.1 hypothetical protein LPJ81_000046 [Coemansia sp. IMI 209127]